MLTAEDWYLIGFYRLVQDQVEGMANLPRLDGYRAALELYEYPQAHHAWLVSGALTLHKLINKQDTVAWQLETGKLMSDIRPEDVS